MCRLIGLVGVVLFLVTAFSPLANRLNQWMAVQPEVAPSDAIVVLGASISASGMLSVESLRRTNRGVELYRRGLAPILVLLGGSRAGGPAEADVCAEQARAQGVPAQAILTETRGNTTREEAVRVQALLRSKGVRTILLVTNAAHLARARSLFERAGFAVHPAPWDSFVQSNSPEARLELMRLVGRELLGWLYYRVVGYI